MTRIRITVGCLLVGLVVSVSAQPTAAPSLTDVQRLTVLAMVQRVEIAQLRAQAAQRDLEALLKSLQVPGFVLDPSTMTYAPAPPPAKGEPEKK